ncbi:hypothetical protein DUI87_05623 [Hirundo rustica rustica]|uniref:Uncharacterized protein n=1 Tax=Hirundo rustica rustica TaxID=333673 RepID=A0A3M0L1Z5_HIRRU|nr:hypothetical protein DUI87_05623 [Hirundo rustica rustica]
MDSAGTSGTSPQRKVTQLWLPGKVPLTEQSSKVILSTERGGTTGRKYQEPQQDAGTDLPPAQGSVSTHGIGLEMGAKKRKKRNSPLPRADSKAQGSHRQS